jgi:hypothetical protein
VPDDTNPTPVRLLNADVAARLEQGFAWGERTTSFLETAAVFLDRALTDPDHGIRLCESACYSVREALDAVTEDAARGVTDLDRIRNAYRRYDIAVEQPGVDEGDARRERDADVRRVLESGSEISERRARFESVWQELAGTAPAQHLGDEYQALRKRANSRLHGDATIEHSVLLYDDALRWFELAFTRPTDRLAELVRLASRVPIHTSDVDRVGELLIDAHHQSFFLSQVSSAEWVQLLWEHRMLPLPRANEVWPVLNLVDGFGRSQPVVIADLLARVLDACKTEADPAASLTLIAHAARRLGPAGDDVTLMACKRAGKESGITLYAVDIALEREPSDPVVLQVARYALAETRRSRDAYRTPVLLQRLIDGVTESNAKGRVKMLASKVRHVAEEGYAAAMLEPAALTLEVDDRAEPLLLLANGLVRLLHRARDVGVPSRSLLDWLGDPTTALDGRIRCQVLARADDETLDDRISLITARLAERAPTGDDLDLIEAIAAAQGIDLAVPCWRAALGEPSVADGAAPPDDWLHVWRWSAVVPAQALDRWKQQIENVNEYLGGSQRTEHLRVREDITGRMLTGNSPYSEEQLAEIAPLDAAALVAAWRPDDTATMNLTSARELGRTLEEVVKANPVDWAVSAPDIVTTLSEPTYVNHYFAGLRHSADKLEGHTSAVMSAVGLAATHPHAPTEIGPDDDHESGWSGVDESAVQLIRALANADAALGEEYELAWSLAHAAVEQRPAATVPAQDFDPTSDGPDDPMGSAINRPYPRALEALFALAAWQYRALGEVRSPLGTVLDELLTLHGQIGLEYRAIIASRRPLLEGIVPDWYAERSELLFGATAPDGLGEQTIDLTIKWAPPTTPFFVNHREAIADAARRQTFNAVRWLLIGMLWEVDGYSPSEILADVRESSQVLAGLGDEIAFLVEPDEISPTQLALGVEVWRGLIALAVDGPPVEVGRWSQVTALDEPTWEELTFQSLELSHGATSWAIEVADRAATAPVTGRALEIFLLLIGSNQGDPWERHHVQSKAIEALRSAELDPTLSVGAARLLDRLLQLGRHDALPPDPADPESAEQDPVDASDLPPDDPEDDANS